MKSMASLLKKPARTDSDTPAPSVEAKVPVAEEGAKKSRLPLLIGVVIGVAALGGLGYEILIGHVRVPFLAQKFHPAAAVSGYPDVPHSPPTQASSVSVHAAEFPVPAARSVSSASSMESSAVTAPSVSAVSAFLPGASSLPGASPVQPTASASNTAPVAATKDAPRTNQQRAHALQESIERTKKKLSALEAKLKSVDAEHGPKPKVIYRTIIRYVPVPAKPAPAPKPKPSAPVHILGAANGVAWVSVHGRTIKVRPGDTLPGIGVVQRISAEGEIRGSLGDVR